MFACCTSRRLQLCLLSKQLRTSAPLTHHDAKYLGLTCLETQNPFSVSFGFKSLAPLVTYAAPTQTLGSFRLDFKYEIEYKFNLV